MSKHHKEPDSVPCPICGFPAKALAPSFRIEITAEGTRFVEVQACDSCCQKQRTILHTIPDAAFTSEKGRRNNMKRKSHRGGAIWSKHVPDYPRCRCVDCNKQRNEWRTLKRGALPELPLPPFNRKSSKVAKPS